MKTISAKQFQLNLSEILGAVAKGESMLITFHNKPWVRLEPAKSTEPAPGSRAALNEALKIRFPGVIDPTISFDELKAQMMRDKFGE